MTIKLTRYARSSSQSHANTPLRFRHVYSMFEEIGGPVLKVSLEGDTEQTISWIQPSDEFGLGRLVQPRQASCGLLLKLLYDLALA